MAAIVSITSIDSTQNNFIVQGKITLSGNYGGGSSHGDVLSFAGFDVLKTAAVPTFVEINEAPVAGTSASGYEYSFSPGVDQSSGKLQIFTSNGAAPAPLAEYPQGTAYQGSQSGAVLNFLAFFPSFA
jgi:hypothetical protein